MKKTCLLLIYCSLLISPLFVVKSNVYASGETLFEDNFDNGSSSNWSIISGQGLWKVENGIFGARIENGNTIIEEVAGNITTPNYLLEYDMYPSEGDDKNVDFRWINPSNNLYTIHFNSDITNFLSRSGAKTVGITFASTLVDIQILYSLNSISLSNKKSLSAIINNANKAYISGRSTPMQTLLDTA